MAKAKLSKRDTTIPNKPLHCRISFLYQAAMHFASLDQATPVAELGEDNNIPHDPKVAGSQPAHRSSRSTSLHPLSRRWVSSLRHISLKAQIRMSPALKHSMCKRCNTVLLNGSTCTIELENQSRNGRKPWADVLVKKCNVCDAAVRFPVMAPRQKRRPFRSTENHVPQACDGPEQSVVWKGMHKCTIEN